MSRRRLSRTWLTTAAAATAALCLAAPADSASLDSFSYAAGHNVEFAPTTVSGDAGAGRLSRSAHVTLKKGDGFPALTVIHSTSIAIGPHGALAFIDARPVKLDESNGKIIVTELDLGPDSTANPVPMSLVDAYGSAGGGLGGFFGGNGGGGANTIGINASGGNNSAFFTGYGGGAPWGGRRPPSFGPFGGGGGGGGSGGTTDPGTNGNPGGDQGCTTITGLHGTMRHVQFGTMQFDLCLPDGNSNSAGVIDTNTNTNTGNTDSNTGNTDSNTGNSEDGAVDLGLWRGEDGSCNIRGDGLSLASQESNGNLVVVGGPHAGTLVDRTACVPVTQLQVAHSGTTPPPDETAKSYGSCELDSNGQKLPKEDGSCLPEDEIDLSGEGDVTFSLFALGRIFDPYQPNEFAAVAAIPEPGPIAAFASGLILIGLLLRRRRSAA